jgi:hypothetical protein
MPDLALRARDRLRLGILERSRPERHDVADTAS